MDLTFTQNGTFTTVVKVHGKVKSDEHASAGLHSLVRPILK
jgi:hypothetical protein